MIGGLDRDQLILAADAGEIDTVLVAFVDMQGRLVGKRFHVQHFLDTAHGETHSCNYLLATDLEMATPPGYAATGWDKGYGDYVMRPDLTTLRLAAWLEGTALVLCDLVDHHHEELIPHAPRSILDKQVQRLDALGYTAMMATELEFFLFEQTYNEAFDTGYRSLTPLARYNQDYQLLSTTKEEHIMRPLRNSLVASGIPVENTKGEAEAGQEELNIRYADAMTCADYHSIAKHATKEVAWHHGHAASFIAKWDHARVGSASHVHFSLWQDGEPAFFAPNSPNGMSEVMRSFCAGVIHYTREYMYFLAPYVNSYKRFVQGSFAPTKAAWSVDNRTAAFRLCGEGSRSIRMECRIGGSDINPYLAEAAILAAGIKGIEDNMKLDDPVTGDVYSHDDVVDLPKTLRAATETLRNATMLREAMGDDVVDHYTRAAEWEQEEFDRVVTDWELARGFEKA